MNEQFAHVGVAAFADASQMRFAAGQILSRCQAQPGAEIACGFKLPLTDPRPGSLPGAAHHRIGQPVH